MEIKYETKETELALPNETAPNPKSTHFGVQFKIGDSSVSFYTLRVTIFFDYGFAVRDNPVAVSNHS